MKPGRLSLRARLQGVILLTTGVALGLTCVAFILYELTAFRRAEEETLRSTATIAADAVGAALAFGDAREATRTLTALRARSELIYAAVYDAEGDPFATFQSPRALNLVVPHPEADGLQREFARWWLSVPVAEDGKRYGTLHLGWDLRPMFVRLRNYGWIALGVFLAAMGAAVIVARLLQESIARPILALTRTSQAVTERHDYSVRAEKFGEDELGVLTDAFNAMLREVQDASRALSEQRRLYQSVTDNTAVALFIIDDQHRCVFMNPSAEQLTGIRFAEAQKRPLQELVDPGGPLRSDGARFAPGVQRALAQCGRAQGEDTFRHRDGRSVVVAFTVSPVPDAAGRAIGTIVEAQDITVRKDAEAALAEAQEELRQHAARLEAAVAERTTALQLKVEELEAFSYSLSHDMRGPLRSMQGFAAALIEEYGTRLDDCGRDYLRRIDLNAQRLDLLVRDVLAYSRIAKEDFKLQPVDLAALLREVIASFPLEESPIALAEPIPPVRGHVALLGQIFSNLLGNALKFRRPDLPLQVRVWAERSDPWVRVWVADNGIGIAPEHFERIFEMFGRVYPDARYEGTGIGLAIVRKAAERLGGRLGVESAPGAGSRFWVELRPA